MLPAEAALDLLYGRSLQLDLVHPIRAQTFGRAQNGGWHIRAWIVPIHQRFANGVHCNWIRATANGIEVFDQVLAIRTERTITLTRIKRIHDKPRRIGCASQIHNLLIDVVAMAFDHPVVIREVSELKLHRARERRVDVDFHLRQADVDVRVENGTRHGKFVEAHWPIDLIHFELGVFEGAEFHPGTLRHFDDTADLHGLHGIGAHRAAFTDLNTRGLLLLDQLDQRLQHTWIRGEAGIRGYGDHGID